MRVTRNLPKTQFTNSIDELRHASNELLDELSNRYVFVYEPTNNARDDTWRQINVDVDGHPRVRARQGYRASRN